MMTMAPYQRRIRWSSFLLGVFILLWLPIEDRNFIAAILLAAAMCFLGGVAILKKGNSATPKYAWVGFLMGLCTGPASFLLWIFKIGIHSHSTPDFNFGQLFELIKLSPVWGITGFLIGMSIHLYQLSRSQ